jgi:hypothetical protein
MAAISAARAHPEYNVAIIDRTFALGRKILVCGAGRCNITNINLGKSVEDRYYGSDPQFIKSVFDQFGYQEIVNFFTDLGIELYVERKSEIGKLFPVTNQAHTVTALLDDELDRLKIKSFLNTEVTEVTRSEGKFKVSARNLADNSETEFNSEYLILSAGGKTYPALGANGSGYELARKLGHKIIEPVPSALPLEGKSELSQDLQGVRMELQVTSFIGGNKIKSSTDEVMFTKYGLSGPAVLNVSREISIRINREHAADCEVELNFFPGLSTEQILAKFEARWGKRQDQTLEKSLFGIFPNKIPPVLLKLLGFDPLQSVGTLSADQKLKLVGALGSYRIKITATRGWNEAEFTAGGIDTTEVKQTTLESELVPQLYFCGEILNVDGDVGGFNLSWAWSSGWAAGKLA